ncbi:uncharacterized protein [Atheta coriaria]|uniref:uncharacterized protein n=1 Tax=Dalotia coriaria TaxID=877792 RepID=UPI0031F3EEE9
MKTKRNGTLSIITQLTSIDMFSSWICIVELLSLKNNAWTFSSELCPLFAGSETLCNTLTLYLIISLNYHTISLCNMKTPPTSSCDASQECLVRDVITSSSSSSTSTSGQTNLTSISTAARPVFNEKQDISVVIPCILIWFTCLSLSIPQFTLSSTIESYSTKNVTCTCTLMDNSQILINLLAIFKVFIPCVLISISIGILIYKLVQSVRNESIPAIFTKKCHNIVYYLIFCLVLNFLYVCTSMQRLILYAMHAYSTPSLKTARIYKLPPLFNEFTGSWIAIALCMLHYSGTFLRFLIYVFLLPKFKSILCNNFLTCFKPKEL